MLSAVTAYLAIFGTLFAVATYALYVSWRSGPETVKTFFSAKNSQGALALAWCFFASGMGSWTLFTFPDIGVIGGSWGVIGYTLSGCLGMLVLGVVGPYTRSILGDGVTLADYLKNRYGRVMQIYVAILSIFFQFISLASEFTCVADLVGIFAPDANRTVAILAVAVTTNVYTLVGGLRASLSTDIWQGMGVLITVLVVCAAMAFNVSIPDGAWERTQIAAFTTAGFEALVTLCLAVTAANLFFTGYWQRVYAAYDDRTLRISCVYACCMIIPFTVALAVVGMAAKLAYPDAYSPFFTVLLNMGTGWQVLVVIIITSLAAAVSDTIQMGISAEFVTNIPRVTLLVARIICVLLNGAALILALQRIDVLRLFLIADLFCATAVGPMVLGAWHRTLPVAAIAGCVVGLVTVFVHGLAVTGTLIGALEWFSVPGGLETRESMILFILATAMPIMTTVGLSLALPKLAPSKLWATKQLQTPLV